jgi:hypothetical protein
MLIDTVPLAQATSGASKAAADLPRKDEDDP